MSSGVTEPVIDLRAPGGASVLQVVVGVERFAAIGFNPKALLPCYGMAEATLAMTFNPLHRGVRTDVIDAETYHSNGEAQPVKRNGNPILEFVSCGAPLPGHSVRIVNDDGAWEGTSTGFLRLKKNPKGGNPYNRAASIAILTGEGAYTGLSAMFRFRQSIRNRPRFLKKSAEIVSPDLISTASKAPARSTSS